MINLESSERKIVEEILKKYLKDCQVIVFGSRLNEKIKKYSDLDLVIIGDKKIEIKLLNRLIEDFEYSKLNFRVDLLDYNRISDSFKRVVDSRYEVLIKL